MKLIPERTEKRILKLLNNGLSTRKVASAVGVSQSAVVKVRQRKTSLPLLIHPYNIGRPRSLTDREEREIVRLIVSNKCSTAIDVQNELKVGLQRKVSVDTIRRALKKNGLSSHIKRKKPLLRITHRKRRLAFAKKYKNWTLDDWKRVVWSDESKFNIWASDGREYCWKKRGSPLRDSSVKPTLKHGGGSIMVWGCVTFQGVGNLCRIDGGLDAQLYRSILEDEMLGTLEWYDLNKGDVIFQHDNDPKHTAKSTTEWLYGNKIEVLGWPAQSPDLNPIEHVWSELDRRLKKYPTKPKNKTQLWERLQDEWNNIDQDFINQLYTSVPERIDAVLKAKGGYTNY